ncbi:hypothetical protein [Pseudobacteriovorax antillogorgiicola]|uniref:Uncharacterized protein n=1 Tax=Pseudobacteriovorax antillogorgiicola TaxID=1513793 RepID=A0A1Y6CRB9_9BACT|nr:hypothetical protein [Pseudobacteriovorax antillogorgiicola]TCS46172.1 hypothetical protein EDD56_12573 [Pseudobacteriovorax antillogorgiicola]SMF69978.1 hypothetical protein SAMN06296036_12573 [Pseudobacteriovorax antillogorgiicola]
MSNRIDQLEYTVMELGSQVFRLKQEVTNLNQSQETFVTIFKKLRSILDEKGVLEVEDFDLITDFYQLIDHFEDPMEAEEEPQTIPKSDLH